MRAFCLSFVVCVLTLSSAISQTFPVETYTVTKEMEFSASRITNRAYSSPLSTYNNAIYFVYADSGLNMVIAKKTPDGTVTTHTIMEQMTNDTHNGPSIGIDADGYIHVVGNMHNDPWRYWISDKPEDISAFTSIDEGKPNSIPGTGISYPYFMRDNDGVLFAAYRHIVAPGSNIPGTRAAGIARYDAAAKTWTALGGTDYRHKIKTFFWNDSGAVNQKGYTRGAYQPCQPRIVFDRFNGMHVSLVVADNTSSNFRGVPKFTHVIYAFSPDGGKTFQKADGLEYSVLPITLDTADIVAGPEFAEKIGGFSYRSAIAVTKEGNPVVKVPTERTNYLTIWNPWTGWPEPEAYGSTYRAQFVIDRNGVWTTFNNGLVRSYDNAVSWRNYADIEAVGYATSFDYSFLRQTRNIRFSNLAKGGIVTVWTVQFSNKK